jgi:hypothetical protein
MDSYLPKKKLMPEAEKFEISYKNKTALVEVVSIGEQKLYKIKLQGQPLLFITRAKNYEYYFWTSVPEGKQMLAEEIGSLRNICNSGNNKELEVSQFF